MSRNIAAKACERKRKGTGKKRKENKLMTRNWLGKKEKGNGRRNAREDRIT